MEILRKDTQKRLLILGGILLCFFVFQVTQTQAENYKDDQEGYFSIDFLENTKGIFSQNNIAFDTISGTAQLQDSNQPGDFTTLAIVPEGLSEWTDLTLDGIFTQGMVQTDITTCDDQSIPDFIGIPLDSGILDISSLTESCIKVTVHLNPVGGVSPIAQDLTLNWKTQPEISLLSEPVATTHDAGRAFQQRTPLFCIVQYCRRCTCLYHSPR